MLASMWDAQAGEMVQKIIKTDNKIVKNGIFIDTKSNVGTIVINGP